MWVVLAPILLFATLMVLLYIPPVQNLIRKQATALASEATGMDISVERIDLRFPLNLLVRGVHVVRPAAVAASADTVAAPADTLLTLAGPERARTGLAAAQGAGGGGRGDAARCLGQLCRPG